MYEFIIIKFMSTFIYIYENNVDCFFKMENSLEYFVLHTNALNVFSIFFLFSFLVKIGIFYAIFYAALAVLVALCMWIFFQTLDPRIPKWKLRESLIGENPGKLKKSS